MTKQYFYVTVWMYESYYNHSTEYNVCNYNQELEQRLFVPW